MIPLSCRENATARYVDEDGIEYTFLAKSGILEHEFNQLADVENRKDETLAQYFERSNAFFDKILVNVVDTKGKYQISKPYSQAYSSKEQGTVYGYWGRASELTDEEKKI